MFLNELVKSARVVEGTTQTDDVTLILAGCRPGVDYSMVVSRETYEAILIRYRASEPAVEAILMSIGKAKGPEDPAWDIMLQNEIVASHYSMLCNDFHAAKLGVGTMEPMHEEPLSGTTGPLQQEEAATEMSSVEETVESNGEEAQDVETEESAVEEPPAEEPAEEPVEEVTEEPSTEEPAEEPPIEEKDFFSGVTGGEEPVVAAQAPASSEFSELEEPEEPPQSYDLLAMAQAQVGVLAKSSGTPTATVSEEPAGVTDELVPSSSEEDDDYFPRGIRPEEEDRKAEEKKVAVPLDQEGEQILSQVAKILSELNKVFYQFGPEVVCQQALKCSFADFRVMWGNSVPGISELDSEQMVDVVREHIQRIVHDTRGDARMQQINIILQPAMKILYEE